MPKSHPYSLTPYLAISTFPLYSHPLSSPALTHWAPLSFRISLLHTTNRFKDIDLERFSKFMEKADHYFFANNVHPRLQTFMPFEQPTDTAVDGFFKSSDSNEEVSKVARLRDAFDREMKKYEAFDASQTLYPNDPVAVTQTTSDNAPDAQNAEQMRVFLTAQQRRAEFWTKFAGMMRFTDAMYDQIVRCTVSTGRVMSHCSLVIMGNKNGVITFGRGKGPNAAMATRRAIFKCRRNVLFVPMHEHRTPFQNVMAKWKCTRVLVKPQGRGFGLHASPAYYTLLEAVGFEDATVRRIGANNIWNGVRAFMEAMRMQRSFRELALARGAHFQIMMNPFFKNPPAPTAAEMRDLEKDAATAFSEAIQDVVRNRDLLVTPAYTQLQPYFEKKAEFASTMDKIFDAKQVPESMRFYPPFTQFLDVMSAAGRETATKLAATDAFERAVDISTRPVSNLEILRGAIVSEGEQVLQAQRLSNPASDSAAAAAEDDVLSSMTPDDHDALRQWLTVQSTISGAHKTHSRPLAEVSSDEESRPVGQRGFKTVSKHDPMGPEADRDVLADYGYNIEVHVNEGVAESAINERVERLVTLFSGRLINVLRAAPKTTPPNGVATEPVPAGASLSDMTMPLDDDLLSDTIIASTKFIAAASPRDIEKLVNHELVELPRTLAQRVSAVLNATTLSEVTSKMAELEALDHEYKYFPADASTQSLLDRFDVALDRLAVDPFHGRYFRLDTGYNGEENIDRVFGDDAEDASVVTIEPPTMSRANIYRRKDTLTSLGLTERQLLRSSGDLLDGMASTVLPETQMVSAAASAARIASMRATLRGDTKVEAIDAEHAEQQLALLGEEELNMMSELEEIAEDDFAERS